MNPAIIIPAFSRPLALKRLLDAINCSYFPTNRANLIISIDGGGDEEVRKIAKSFVFAHGSCEVVCRSENIGLREHILWCGDQTKKYSSVIVIEDDIHVDPFFYLYAIACIDFYRNDGKVAGIALYSPHYNEYANLPFEATYNGTSTYFMQIPCSWGQAWTREQWKDFRKWYGSGEVRKVNECGALPINVKRWSDNSWKKFFSAYLVESTKYFVYPYISYTTNCDDPGGTHRKTQTSLFQVPLAYPFRNFEHLSFDVLENTNVSYDSFMEPSSSWVEKLIGIQENNLSIDLYASKPIKLLQTKKLCLTSRKTDKKLSGYPLSFHPIELNLNLSLDSKAEELSLIESKFLTISASRNKTLITYNLYLDCWRRNFIEFYISCLPRKLFKKIAYEIKKIRISFKSKISSFL